MLHHSHNPGHPLGWTGLVESLPPPPGALPLPPPPPPHNSAGDPNGHPPPGNSGTPVSTGQVMASPGQLTAGSLLADSLLADWPRPAPAVATTIIYQLGTAVPGAELQPARPLVPTPTTTRTPTPAPAAGPRPPTPPPHPPVWSGQRRGPAAPEPSVPGGSGGPRTLPRSGLSPMPPGTPRCPGVAAISMVTITLLLCLAGSSRPTVMTRGRPVGSGDLSSASATSTLELLSQVSRPQLQLQLEY